MSFNVEWSQQYFNNYLVQIVSEDDPVSIEEFELDGEAQIEFGKSLKKRNEEWNKVVK